MALHVNDRFERATVRFVFPNKFYHRSRIATRQDEDRTELALWIVPKINGARFAIVCIDNRDTVLRKEASMASTRMINNLKIDRRTFNPKGGAYMLIAFPLSQRGDD